MVTITIEVTRFGVSKITAPASSLADHAEIRQLLERASVPLDLLNRSIQSFNDDPKPIPHFT